jgi:hypothetical protein
VKWLRIVVSAILLLSSAPAYAQGVGCQRLSVAGPDASSPYVDEYAGPLGLLLLLRLTGQPVSGDRVLVLKGEELVWVVVVRGEFGCPLEPVARREYDAARRPLLGTSG